MLAQGQGHDQHPREEKGHQLNVPQLPCGPPTVPSSSSVALKDLVLAGSSEGDLGAPWTQWIRPEMGGGPVFMSLPSLPLSPALPDFQVTSVCVEFYLGAWSSAGGDGRGLGLRELTGRGRCAGATGTWVQIRVGIYLVAVWPRADYITSLGLHDHICKMGERGSRVPCCWEDK